MKINMDYSVQDVRLEILTDLEGPEPDREFLKSVQDFGVIYPIVLCQNAEGMTIIDGRRRIKAALRLGHDTIKAITYTGLSPDDKAAWTLILNEQRSNNIISEYRYYSQLLETKDWDTLREEYGFNKSHVQKILTLGKIKELSKFTAAYEEGSIAETTLFAIAKLPEERQDYLEDVYDHEGKVTMTNVKEAKQLRKAEAVASMPKLDVTIPEKKTCIYEYAVYQGVGASAELFRDFKEAYEYKNTNPGSTVFKLEVM
jgi:ParB/RepB/Spo0J family partition protein